MTEPLTESDGALVTGTRTASTPSLLFPEGTEPIEPGETTPPDFFADVNLDQVVERVLAGLAEYRLDGVFHHPMPSSEAVDYRQDVFRDLDGESLRADLTSFTDAMRRVRGRLAMVSKVRMELQREGWFLSGALAYCEAVSRLERALQAARLRSAGLRAAHDYVTAYCASPRFRGLEEAARSTRAALDGVTYCLDVNYGNVRVTRFEGQADYAEQVTETFQRFRAGGHVIVTAEQDNLPDLNHVEAAILEMVARLFPQQFAAQHAFCQQHQDFVDPGLSVLDRDAMFYLAYLDFLQPLRDAGLPVCYPRVTGSKEVVVDGAYDLALASQATHRGVVVVGNDIELRRRERVLVVTGPNQGGKTTFARTFAQLHWLGALGCPVPGQTARLFLPDRIRTHFDRQEDLADLRGKLEDDLVRIREILDQATPRTIVVTNELFASTSLADAHELGGKVIRRILERDLLAVYVTFVDELASLTPQVVSMTATVDEKDPAIRTYRVVRRRADGRAYASAIAAKYGLDRTTLKERLAR